MVVKIHPGECGKKNTCPEYFLTAQVSNIGAVLGNDPILTFGIIIENANMGA